MDKIKVLRDEIDIIVLIIKNKPCYAIKYRKLNDIEFTVGYGSYDLNTVREWYRDCFEIWER